MPRSSSRSLPPLPEGFKRSRRALHRVAEQIVAPARKPDNEISLRATDGGFGTPSFEHEGVARQVMATGAELVYVRGDEERRAPLDSLSGAAELVADLLPAGGEVDASPLGIDPAAADALAAWFALGLEVLTELASEGGEADAPTAPLLWPEHFDLAIEAGAEGEGRRANYGFSPGDDEHPEPYLYVGPWSGDVHGELWNATGFSGAEIGYAELHAVDDPLAAALAFCRERKHALDSMEVP